MGRSGERSKADRAATDGYGSEVCCRGLTRIGIENGLAGGCTLQRASAADDIHLGPPIRGAAIDLVAAAAEGFFDDQAAGFEEGLEGFGPELGEAGLAACHWVSRERMPPLAEDLDPYLRAGREIGEFVVHRLFCAWGELAAAGLKDGGAQVDAAFGGLFGGGY